MNLSIQQLTYVHPDKEVLFQNISFSVNKAQKVALIGNNGCGKSTLLQIIGKELSAAEGVIICPETPYYVPQHFGQYDKRTVAEALKANDRIEALHAIIGGNASAYNFTRLNDDWEIEERCLTALASWGLNHLSLQQPMLSLSGGEKTKVFLAGIAVHNPEVILMDEPTNHLDTRSREQLYEFIRKSNASILIVSHDRTLLNQLDFTFEMTRKGITAYGGNYEFYKAQKKLELNALQAQLGEKEKSLRLAKKTAREAAERKQKQDVRGKKSNEKGGIPRIMMNVLKDKAEKSTTKLNDIHAEKMEGLSSSISQLRNALPGTKSMKLNFDSSNLHIGKILVNTSDVCFQYNNHPLWQQPLSFQIRSGERIAISGGNGSGKTTLLKLILGELEPTKGEIDRAQFSPIYVDQEYSLIRKQCTLLEQVIMFNSRCLPEHEIKIILNRYLFPKEVWNKSCNKLSGGEKMRLMFCCLMVSNNMPDLFVLDEPTNNLDIQSMEIITEAIKEYRGTLLVVSHDSYFIEEIAVERVIVL